VDERLEHRLAEEVGQVLARLAEPRTLADRVADAEPPPDEIVQADPAGRDVAPALARAEDDALARLEVLDDLGLDERDVAVDARVRRPLAGPRGVAIALEPDAGDRPDAVAADHRLAAAGRDVDRHDGAGRRDERRAGRLAELVGCHRANSTRPEKALAGGRMLSTVRARGAKRRRRTRKENRRGTGSSRRGRRVTPPEGHPLVAGRISAAATRTVRRGRSLCVRTGA